MQGKKSSRDLREVLSSIVQAFKPSENGAPTHVPERVPAEKPFPHTSRDRESSGEHRNFPPDMSV